MKMSEESVFTEALAKGVPQERAAFLDQQAGGRVARQAANHVDRDRGAVDQRRRQALGTHRHVDDDLLSHREPGVE